jgi:hypothetical protein
MLRRRHRLATCSNLTLSIPPDLAKALRDEYSRLEQLSPQNPGAPSSDRFLRFCIVLGLEQLAEMPAEEALNLVLNAESRLGRS